METVIKRSKTHRVPVEARPSRIRREPPAPVIQKKVQPYPTEREIIVVVIGVVLFALAITAVTFGISVVTGK